MQEGENMDVGETSLICTWTFSTVTVHKHAIPKAACFHLQVKKDLLYNAYPGPLVESVSDKKPKNKVMQRCSDINLCEWCIFWMSEKFRRISEGYSITTVFF